jgi:hypothetical protein
MKKLSIAAVFVALALSLTGCAVTSGTVTEKRIVESYSYETQECFEYDALNHCRRDGTVTNSVEKSYILKLRQGYLEANVPVSASTFDRVEVGDWFDLVGNQ